MRDVSILDTGRTAVSHIAFYQLLYLEFFFFYFFILYSHSPPPVQPVFL